MKKIPMEEIANVERAVQSSLKNQAGKEEKNYINKRIEAEGLIQIPGHSLSAFTKENQALGKYLESTKERWENLVESLSGKVSEKNKAEADSTAINSVYFKRFFFIFLLLYF